jgi:hypothetical protein
MKIKLIIILSIILFFGSCKLTKEEVANDSLIGRWSFFITYSDTIKHEVCETLENETYETFENEDKVCQRFEYVEITFSDSIIIYQDEWTCLKYKYCVKNDTLYFFRNLLDDEAFRYKIVWLGCSSILLKNDNYEIVIEKYNYYHPVIDVVNCYDDNYSLRQYNYYINNGIYDYDDICRLVTFWVSAFEIEEETLSVTNN